MANIGVTCGARLPLPVRWPDMFYPRVSLLSESYRSYNKVVDELIHVLRWSRST